MSLKIGVLMGGDSHEKDVSISTGNEVLKALKTLNHQPNKILINGNYEDYLEQFRENDLIFNALHGGKGEDGNIQRWMEKNNIRYTGSGPLSSALCMDKANSKDFAALMGIQTPKWQLFNDPNTEIVLIPPMIIKPNSQGSTFGLTIVEDKMQLEYAINKAFQFGNGVIAEEYIEGREITVPILEDTVYPIIEIVPSHNIYDFKCKYTPGMTKYICPAKLDKKVESIIKENSKLLFNEFDCKVYARVDYIIGKNDTPYFLEVNTLPGMTKTSLFPKSLDSAGLDFSSLVSKIIDLSL